MMISLRLTLHCSDAVHNTAMVAAAAPIVATLSYYYFIHYAPGMCNVAKTAVDYDLGFETFGCENLNFYYSSLHFLS